MRCVRGRAAAGQAGLLQGQTRAPGPSQHRAPGSPDRAESVFQTRPRAPAVSTVLESPWVASLQQGHLMTLAPSCPGGPHVRHIHAQAAGAGGSGPPWHPRLSGEQHHPPSALPGGQDWPGLPGGPLVGAARAAGPRAERQLPGPLPGRARGLVQGVRSARGLAWRGKTGRPFLQDLTAASPRCCSSARPTSPRPSRSHSGTAWR